MDAAQLTLNIHTPPGAKEQDKIHVEKFRRQPLQTEGLPPNYLWFMRLLRFFDGSLRRSNLPLIIKHKWLAYNLIVIFIKYYYLTYSFDLDSTSSL